LEDLVHILEDLELEDLVHILEDLELEDQALTQAGLDLIPADLVDPILVEVE